MKIAFVVQRYGVEVNGGAELYCRWLAEHLAASHEVTVLTTCARDYYTWKNEYPEGFSQINDVRVRRFPVDWQKNNDEVSEFSNWMRSHPHTREDEIHWMRLFGPYSSRLLEFLGESRDHFDLFIFVTYLYATTYFGLPMVSGKAWLVPTAHDEAYIRMPLFRDLFERPDLLLFSTPEEKHLIEKLFPDLQKPSEIVGVGIDVPQDISPERFLAKLGRQKLGEHLLLYLGRVDEAKGCGQLFKYFGRYVEERKASLSLLVAGERLMPIPDTASIVPLGFVTESDKFDAITAATLTINPSPLESLSMIVLESWMMGKTVLVNGRCPVLEGQCRRSNGGLWYKNYEEFAEALSLLLEQPHMRNRLGRNGKHFAEDNYSWPIIVQKYERLFQAYAQLPQSTSVESPRVIKPSRSVGTVHIMLPHCAPHDAVSNDAILQHKALREAGYRTILYAGSTAPDLNQFVRSIDRFPEPGDPQDVLLYHHSTGWKKGSRLFERFPGKRILKYHNVTPSTFFQPYWPDYSSVCDEARKDLARLVRLPDVWFAADSKFDLSELLAQGVRLARISVLAPFHQIQELQHVLPNEEVLREFGNGRTNLLFVGRVVPHKGYQTLIEAFAHYHARNTHSQLLIAGALDACFQKYYSLLGSLIRRLGLTDTVRFLGPAGAGELRALYERANVFVCASEHEGFCVPIVEAMAFRVPVIACGQTAVRETLGGTGICWPQADPVKLAESIDLCVRDASVAQSIREAENRRYTDTYSDAVLTEKFLTHMQGVLGQ